MSQFQTIEKISEATLNSELQNRRDHFKKLGALAKTLAVTAVPTILLSSIPKISKAATNDVVIDAMNFLLKVEYLQNDFYTQALASGIIPSGNLTAFQQIAKQNAAQVDFLALVIQSYGGKTIAKPTFNFTLSGSVSPFTVFTDFLLLSQAFSDLAVRAYKGQAGNLISNNDLLTASVQLQSVEARHAAIVRRLRAKMGADASLKGWVTANNRGTLPASLQPIYDLDDTIQQYGVVLSGITSVTGNALTEAFDEPLTSSAVTSILANFIV
ncbi:MAG: ferritin-like domain-containing protein [Chitinophagales bacterium]